MIISISPKALLPGRFPVASLAKSRRCACALACALTLTLLAAASAQASSSFFTKLPTEMTAERADPAGAALPDGDVLITGGYSQGGILKSAEVFDPLTGAFTALSGTAIAERDYASAAALPEGKGVLIVGGSSGYAGLKSAEIFNPSTQAFEAVAGEMTVERYGEAAALLPDGKVLVVGGTTGYVSLRSAELFDPATGTFEALTAEATEARFGAAVTVLPDGKVLIAGGGGYGALRSAELFDPATKSFERLPAEMTIERNQPAVAALPNGQILIVGSEATGGTGRSTEIFDPATETFERLSAETTEARHASVVAALPDGNVLIAGGYGPGGGRILRSAEEASDLVPAARIAGGGFGDQQVGESSALQTLVITSVGPNALSLAGATLSGAQAGAFAIEQDACAGTQLDFRQICTIGVSFTPPTAGAFSATLTLTDNEPVPAGVTLSGTGLAAAAGTGSAAGNDTATGNGTATGTGSAAGASATVARAGSSPSTLQGTTSGTTAPAGKKVDLIACAPVLVKGAKRGSQPPMRCTTKLVSGPVRLQHGSRMVKATLSRGGRFFATGAVDTRDGKAEFVAGGMGMSGALPRGACTLTVSRKLGTRTVTTYRAVVIV